MTSQLNVDTIVDKAGSGGSNIKIANTSVAVSEGGTATTTTLQGLAKAWGHIAASDSTTFDDSFMFGTVTDNELVIGVMHLQTIWLTTTTLLFQYMVMQQVIVLFQDQLHMQHQVYSFIHILELELLMLL